MGAGQEWESATLTQKITFFGQQQPVASWPPAGPEADNVPVIHSKASLHIAASYGSRSSSRCYQNYDVAHCVGLGAGRVVIVAETTIVGALQLPACHLPCPI